MPETTIVLIVAIAFAVWVAAFMLMYSLCVVAAAGDRRLVLESPAAPDPDAAGPRTA
jgi:hypothetical protein